VTATPRRPRRSVPRFDERQFHRWLARVLPAGRAGLLPLGDDAAALTPPPGSVAVATTDSLVEGTHFLRSSPPGRIGRAATAVSLSDLASKGARPAAVLIALILPPSTPRRWAEAVVRGAEAEAVRFGAHVLGGDTKAGAVPTVVSSAIGWGRVGRLAPRSRALPGDAVVTTGTVGRGGLAYERLRGAGRASPAAAATMLAVEPRVREGVALARWAHAMLDTSDGLAESCRLLARASRVRLRIDESQIPFVAGLARRTGPAALRSSVAFFGGDYELLATLPRADLNRATRSVRAVGGRLTAIGTVERGSGAWLMGPSGARPMPAGGWDPFAPPAGGPGRPGSRRPMGRYRRVHVTLK